MRAVRREEVMPNVIGGVKKGFPHSCKCSFYCEDMADCIPQQTCPLKTLPNQVCVALRLSKYKREPQESHACKGSLGHALPRCTSNCSRKALPDEAHLALCLASWERQLRLLPSNFERSWHRPHCWQNRCRRPFRTNSRTRACVSHMRHLLW